METNFTDWCTPVPIGCLRPISFSMREESDTLLWVHSGVLYLVVIYTDQPRQKYDKGEPEQEQRTKLP